MSCFRTLVNTLDDAVAKIKQDSRHYAKRQLTWFRNKMNVQWYDLLGRNTTNEIEAVVKNWLKIKVKR